RAAKRIATLNMNGFGSLQRDHRENKWSGINRLMVEKRIAVLMLQETHLTEESKLRVEAMFSQKLRIFYTSDPAHPTRRNGVAIVLNKRLISAEEARETVIVPGHALHLSVQWQPGEHKDFLAVYAPTSAGATARKNFFKEVAEFYGARPNMRKPCLMGGDFNCIEDEVDRLPMRVRRPKSDPSIEELDNLKMGLGLKLTDGWRATYPDSLQYTFVRRSEEHGDQLSRLDRIYCTETVFRTARQWQIDEAPLKTDHSIVSVMVTSECAPEVGKGRWRLPEYLIQDRVMLVQVKRLGLTAQEKLRRLVADGSRTEDENPQTILFQFKEEVTKLAKERQRALVPSLQQKIKATQKELVKLAEEKEMESTQRARATASLKSELQKLERYRQDQLRARMRTKYKANRELPTKTLTNLFKETKPRDVIYALEKDGETTPAGEPVYETNSVKMAELARHYHENLQRDVPDSGDNDDREACIREALASVQDARLSDEQTAELDKTIQYDEVELALRFSKNASAPGIDGIPYEFWKAWHSIFEDDVRLQTMSPFDVVGLLHAALVDIQAHGVCRNTHFAKGWMCPLYKKNERTNIANYRPITLLNTDYKLLTKVLLIRL
ncbi:Endonuclease/exonuclease/phosphatase, partial [Schizophyllum fasciatum]